jgi:hypothetical protein
LVSGTGSGGVGGLFADGGAVMFGGGGIGRATGGLFL